MASMRPVDSLDLPNKFPIRFLAAADATIAPTVVARPTHAEYTAKHGYAMGVYLAQDKGVLHSG